MLDLLFSVLHFYFLCCKITLYYYLNNVGQLSSYFLSYFVKTNKFGQVRWLARVFVIKFADLKSIPCSPHGGKRELTPS